MTESERAAAALRINELALKAVSQGVLVAGIDRKIISANDAFASITGYAETEIMGRNCSFLQGPMTSRQTIADIRLALQNGTEFSGEILNYRKDGTSFWNRLRISPVRDDNGQLTHFIGMTIDYTERKQAQEAFNRTLELLERTGEMAKVGGWELDLQSSRLFWSLETYRIHEVDPATEPSLDRAIDFYAPEVQPILLAAVEAAITQGSSYDLELPFITAKGQPIWVRTQGTAVVEDGKTTKLVGTFQNITERKRAEATSTLLEAQLREAQKMQAVGTLAGGIAHDFNNILATILGNSELARQDVTHVPRALESLEEIRKAATRARDLVQQMLSFSRRDPSEHKAVLLAPHIEETVRLLRATLPAGLTLGVECDAAVPAVLADATQVQQVVINLVNNSIHAMQGRPGHIGVQLDTVMLNKALVAAHPTLAVMHAKHPGQAVRLRVSDQGMGMNAATLERIFEPFFTTKSVDEGTGLGLSVVHGVIHRHGGAVVVESRLNEGATFTCYLPFAEAMFVESIADNSRQTRTTPDTSVAGDISKRRKPHILYLDDDDSLVFLIKRLMERRGYRISGYLDQRAALEALRADPTEFDLVVTDYNMPGLSGLDVARAVRIIRPDLPVAIVSGFIEEALHAQAKSAGVRELIFKANAVEDICDAFARLADS